MSRSDRDPMPVPRRRLRTFQRRALPLATATWLLLRAKVAPPSRPVPLPYRRVFIGGCPRSGTSWVRDMLRQHPDVVTEGEAHVWTDIFEPLRRSGRGLAGWAGLLKLDAQRREERKGIRLPAWIDRRDFLRLVCWAMGQPGSAEQVAEALIAALFDHYMVRNGKDGSVLVEKTPANILYAERILRLYPDAKFIEVRRDGRDVLVSLDRVAHRRHFPENRADQIATWVKSVEAGITLQARHDAADRVLIVRYEEMKADPIEGIKRLWDFAELDYEPHQVDEAAYVTSFEILTQRRKSGDGLHLRKGVVGDWAANLDDDALAMFRELAAETFTAAGYSF